MEKSVEQLREIDRVFAAALEAAPGERTALLARLRVGDPELAEEVGELLRLAEQPDSRLTPERVLAGPLWDDGLVAQKDERIGAYRVLHEIGRGGMATVFLAERADGAFRQQVALKLLRHGSGGEETVRRFAQERQILATLSHPSIARLLDGGIDPKGRPYIVMEHVEGMPIDRYCAEHRLSIDQRLELFKVVARALLYAHRNLVIHRDLKPSNIFVTGGGEVKLLDFGIAKLLDPELSDPFSAPPTRTVARVMTPEYASPEQVRGEQMTTASDVYQLGLLLYELLTGQRAYRVGRATLGEAELVICTEVPRRPSAVVEPALARRLRGDLDDIVQKALRKEPERRYPLPGLAAGSALTISPSGDAYVVLEDLDIEGPYSPGNGFVTTARGIDLTGASIVYLSRLVVRGFNVGVYGSSSLSVFADDCNVSLSRTDNYQITAGSNGWRITGGISSQAARYAINLGVVNDTLIHGVRMESNSAASIFTSGDGTHIAHNRFECHVNPALPFCLATTRAVEIAASATGTTLVDNIYSGIGVVDLSTAHTTYRFDNGQPVEISPPAGTGALAVRLTGSASPEFEVDDQAWVRIGPVQGAAARFTVNADVGEDALRVRTAGTTRLMVMSTGNVGVGTSLPGARLQVAGGDAYVSTVGNGMILRSPNGNCFRMTVSNAGTLGSAAVGCP